MTQILNIPYDLMKRFRRDKSQWELFVFDLSFFGWALLIGFVDGFGASLGITLLGVSVLGYIGYVFLLPYMNLSYSLYYRQLTAVPASGAGDEWTPEL